MKIIGLTGGIASGKSTVSRLLQQQGYPVVDTDKIAWQLAEPEGALWQQYVRRYGKNALHEDRTLNRQAVADIVFSQPEEKKWMDGMAHPLIQQAVEQSLRQLEQQGCQTVFLDVPLLYEVGWDRMVQAVWVVYVDYGTQVARLCQRNGFDRQEAERRIAVQLPMAQKRDRAQVVIDNNGSPQELEQQVLTLLKGL